VKILIPGGSGLVGVALTHSLLKAGHSVNILSRKKKHINNGASYFYWNLNSNEVDEKAFLNVDAIINLAGTNVGDKHWSTSRKKDIFNSRIDSVKLLRNNVEKLQTKPKVFISASGTGFYDDVKSNRIFNEDDSAGNNFLANVCLNWEIESQKFESLGIRTVILRTGIVLSKDGGFIKKVAKVINLNLGAALGNGSQIMPWIQINDLVSMYIHLLNNNESNGVYNAVSPQIVTNTTMMSSIAKAKGKQILLPNIPSFVIKLLFGEMSSILLNGNAVSSQKILNQNFKFKYTKLNSALTELF
jgi:uncharacterized protein (TIGR01777 family)